MERARCIQLALRTSSKHSTSHLCCKEELEKRDPSVLGQLCVFTLELGAEGESPVLSCRFLLKGPMALTDSLRALASCFLLLRYPDLNLCGILAIFYEYLP